MGSTVVCSMYIIKSILHLRIQYLGCFLATGQLLSSLVNLLKFCLQLAVKGIKMKTREISYSNSGDYLITSASLSPFSNLFLKLHVSAGSSWRRQWQSTCHFLPGEFHGQRSLAGYSPQSHSESDTTEATQLAPMLVHKTVYDCLSCNLLLKSVSWEVQSIVSPSLGPCCPDHNTLVLRSSS